MSDKQETNFKYGKLTANKAEAISWDKLSVDIIGPYKIRIEGHDNLIILEPLIVTYNRRKGIPGSHVQKNLIEAEYVIIAKCATTANPQVNSIFEIISTSCCERRMYV